MTADTQWSQLLEKLHQAPVISPRGLLTKELLVHRSIVDMHYPIVTNSERKISYQFMAAEAEWILSGSNDVRELLPFAPSMSRFSDDGLRLQGAYGVMFTEQVRYVCETLTDDSQSRQAVMTFWRPNPRPSKDIPCTVSLQFLIREGLIYTVATMRSSDAWLGWPYDVFSFTMISAYVALTLNKKYQLEKLHLIAGSQHVYEQNWTSAECCCDQGEIRNYSPISLNIFESPDHLRDCLRAFRDDRSDQLPPNFLPQLCQ